MTGPGGMPAMTRFSVNPNQFAWLRNARGANKPDLLGMARRCLAAGVHATAVISGSSGGARPDKAATAIT